MNKKEFYPNWYHEAPPARSFRSILKWGSPTEWKAPNRRLYAEMKRVFGMTDEDFKEARSMGLEEVPEEGYPPVLPPEDLAALASLVGGAENARTDVYTRLSVAYGKTMYDLLRLREGRVENLPDIVLYPRSREDLRAIVDYCSGRGVPLYVYGGGSTVTRGVEPVRGGVSLDMRVHLKRVLRFDEADQTIMVEAGISGPDLEGVLRDAPRTLGARRGYTLGHLPQSFEYSVVGGWVVTRGAGQNSTYYGKIEDMVLSQDFVAPSGDYVTETFPAHATGPDLDQILIGSEGAYGVLYSVTLKLRRYMPRATRRYSYVFRDWESALDAAREAMQGETGLPSVFRLSDPEETDIAMKLYHVEGTVLDWALRVLGYKPGKRCLLLGSADGSPGYTRLVKRSVARAARGRGAMPATGFVTRAWEHGRFRDPYLRDDLQDYGVLTDTLECAVTWSNLERVHHDVRGYCHSRPNTICMTHVSHFYPQGCNLYFIFIARIEDTERYRAYQAGILDAIQRSGAAMSHHHGIGKSFAPWLEAQIGAPALGVLRALKAHFDPKGVMNPGGTLALDLPDGERRILREGPKPTG